MSQLRDWLRVQYGQGKRFKSARQLSLAVSAQQRSHNPNLVYDIENRGTAKIETLLISKVNTAAQILLAAVILAIAAMELKEGELPWMQVYIAWGLTYLVAVTTFLSGAGYIVKWGRKAESMEDSP